MYWLDGHVYNADDAGAKKVPEGRWSNKGFRLPTEAEWEWAAQDGSARSKWAGTNNESALTSYAWYESSSGYKTHEVKQKNANAFGLFDMSGNVNEWCWDGVGFSNGTPTGGLTDPLGAEDNSYKIHRGGSYQSEARYNACAFRLINSPAFFLTPDMYSGIRLACGAMTPTGRYTVRFSAEGGRIEANIGGKRFYSGDMTFAGQKVSFHAYADDSDYELKNWTNNGTVIAGVTTDVYTHTVTADADIKVSFKKKSDPIIRFGVDGGHGTLKAVVGGTEIHSGDQVPLRTNVYFIAKPESGYTVEKWTKNGVTVNGTHLAYNYYAFEDMDVRVKFKVKTYTVRFGAEGGGTVSATVDGSPISSPCEVREGKQVVFSGTPNEGHRLEKWTRNGNGVGTAPTYTYTVDSNIDVKAHFPINNARVIFGKASGEGRVKAYVNGNEIQSGISVPYGTEVHFSAWPFGQSAIDKWELNGSELTETGVGTEYTYTVKPQYNLQETKVRVYFSEPDWDKFFTTAGVSFKMRLICTLENIPLGLNGYTDNEPHSVNLSSYYIGETEVTQELWKAVMGINPSYFQGSLQWPALGEVQKKRPVERVSWYECIAFCNELTKKAGLGESECVYWFDGNPYDSGDASRHDKPEMKMERRGFRLPTEAEWEWAAAQNGLHGLKYAGTNEESDVGYYAWYDENSDGKTHQVKKKNQNPNQLYDMSGNVDEWCWDWYTDTTPAGGTNPIGPADGTSRVYRGGYYACPSHIIMCAKRSRMLPKYSDKTTGLRVVKRP